MCEATYCMYLCRVICVDNKLLAGRKCDISVCAADIFKPRDYLVRGKSVFSYCGIILLITRPDYTFSRRATFSPDAFITVLLCKISAIYLTLNRAFLKLKLQNCLTNNQKNYNKSLQQSVKNDFILKFYM